MSIASEITRLQNAKSAIKTSIQNKGVPVSSDATLDEYSVLIDVIPTGGGGDVPSNLSVWAYDDNGNITSMVFTASTVPASAYSYSKLETVILSSDVTSIGDYAFQQCKSLSSATIGNNVTSIGQYAFQYCSGLPSITIPDSVTSIGQYAFYQCYGLTSVSIGNSVTSIGQYAFYQCSGLTSIDIPDSVTSIGHYAFFTNGLTDATIGSGVTSIGQYAFRNCYALTSITMEATTPPTLNDNGVFTNTGMCPIYCPSDSVDTYRSASNWSYYANRIVAEGWTDDFTVTELRYSVQTGTSEFTTSDATEITSAITRTNSIYQLSRATIGDSVTSIAENAFSGATNLGTVVTSDNSQLETIGQNAFKSCQNLTSINIPYGVTSIGQQAFFQCYGLSSIDIPDSVTIIGDSAFQYCSALSSVTIGNGVTSIGSSTFYQCNGLTSVSIGNSVTSIGERAFYRCIGLTSIVIPDSVTSIGKDAFNSCSALSSVTIGNGVTSIGIYAFKYCTGLTSITCEATTPPSLGNTAFNDTNDCPIYVPSDSVDAYKSSWSAYESRIQAIPET